MRKTTQRQIVLEKLKSVDITNVWAVGMPHTEEMKQHLSKLRTTHGYSQDTKGLGYRTFTAWRSMKARCRNTRNKSFAQYGGRGITVCDRWYQSFESFLEDMGVKPEGTSLGRIDNNGNYCKENCRWESFKEQARNRRGNTVITFRGEGKTLQEWSEIVGIGRDAIAHRLRAGWSVEDALTLRPRTQKNSRSLHV